MPVLCIEQTAMYTPIKSTIVSPGNPDTTVSIYREQTKRPFYKYRKCNDGVDLSIFEGLTLSEYIQAKKRVCDQKHSALCTGCCGMLKVADKVLSEGLAELKEAYSRSSSKIPYKSCQAKRKLLKMPLVCLHVSNNYMSKLFLVDKMSNIEMWKSVLPRLLPKKKDSLSKQTFKTLLSLCTSDEERKRLKYAVTQSSGISNTALRNKLGWEDMRSNNHDVKQAMKEMKCCVKKLAHLEDKQMTCLLGISDEETEQNTDEDDLLESDTDCEKDYDGKEPEYVPYLDR